MNVQNSYITPATSWCYVWHPVTNHTLSTADMIPLSKKDVYHLLVQCHLYPIRPSILPVNLAYILILLSQMLTALYRLLMFHVPDHIHFSKPSSFIQGLLPILRHFVCFITNLSPMPNLSGGPPLVSCPSLLIHYIHSYVPGLPLWSSGQSSWLQIHSRHYQIFWEVVVWNGVHSALCVQLRKKT
jgi:hypothetical protein